MRAFVFHALWLVFVVFVAGLVCLCYVCAFAVLKQYIITITQQTQQQQHTSNKHTTKTPPKTHSNKNKQQTINEHTTKHINQKTPDLFSTGRNSQYPP